MKGMKGNIPIDMIVIMVIVVFVLGFMVVISSTLNNSIQEKTAGVFNQTMLNKTDSSLGMFNAGIPFMFIMFMLGAMWLAWKLKAEPIFLIIIIIIVGVTAIIGASISNTWYDTARQDSLVDASNDFDYMTYMIENLPLFLVVLGFVILIFMFAKPSSGVFGV